MIFFAIPRAVILPSAVGGIDADVVKQEAAHSTFDADHPNDTYFHAR